MSYSTVMRFIVSVLTALTVLAMIALTVFSVVKGLPILLTVVGLMLTAGFGFFSYRDYLHYFKNKG